MIVRISKGTVPVDRFDQARQLMAASEAALREAITALPGLLHYYVGVDEHTGQVTNVSVWDTLEHAQAMSSLPEMSAQRPVLEAAGVVFEPISNHEVSWSITP